MLTRELMKHPAFGRGAYGSGASTPLFMPVAAHESGDIVNDGAHTPVHTASIQDFEKRFKSEVVVLQSKLQELEKTQSRKASKEATEEVDAGQGLEKTSSGRPRDCRRQTVNTRPSLMQRRICCSGSRSLVMPKLGLDVNKVVADAELFRQISAVSTPGDRYEGISDRYEMLEILGKGQHASVSRASRKADGQEVVLKVTRSREEEMDLIAKREYDILREVQHPHIVRALDFFTTHTGSVMVLEYLQGMFTLEEGVSARPGGALREGVACDLTRSLMQAVAHLHQHGFIHRDIKIQNILISGDKATGEMNDLRIIDFNTALRKTDGCFTMTGTMDYMAPEVLLGDSHTELSDVWAVGICLQYMLSGALPWDATLYTSHYAFGKALTQGSGKREALLAAPLTQPVSAECGSLLRHCLSIDTSTRPTSAVALEDAWLQ